MEQADLSPEPVPAEPAAAVLLSTQLTTALLRAQPNFKLPSANNPVAVLPLATESCIPTAVQPAGSDLLPATWPVPAAVPNLLATTFTAAVLPTVAAQSLDASSVHPGPATAASEQAESAGRDRSNRAQDGPDPERAGEQLQPEQAQVHRVQEESQPAADIEEQVDLPDAADVINPDKPLMTEFK